MNFVNLTSSDIVIDTGSKVFKLQRDGTVASLTKPPTVVSSIVHSIPVSHTDYGDIRGLPAPVDGVIWVTSPAVAKRASQLGRSDVVTPDTGPTAHRDEHDRLLAVRGFFSINWA